MNSFVKAVIPKIPMIDWANFTPWASLAGGLLIGLTTSMFVLINGRVAGISGILGGLLRPVKKDILWRIAFLSGLVLAPLAYGLFVVLPTVRIEANNQLLILAGLLVGLGTRYGSGCTSGHGICGLARLSPRALVATIAFMSAGFVVVYIMRHLIN